MNKIQRVSTCGYALSWIVAILSIALPVVLWATAPDLFNQNNSTQDAWIRFYNWLPAPIPTHFSIMTKIEGFSIELPSTLLIFFCWLNAARFFQSCRTHTIYTNTSVVRLRRMGWLLLASTLLQLPTQAALSTLLTLANGTGHGTTVITMSTHDFANIALSVILLLASWVIAEGVTLKCDNEAII